MIDQKNNDNNNNNHHQIYNHQQFFSVTTNRPQTVFSLRRPDINSQSQNQNKIRIPLGIQHKLINSRKRRQQHFSMHYYSDWKFVRLDQNGDRQLSSDEFSLLIDFSRRSTPKLANCAVTLFQYCDSNHDSVITRIEFIFCFNPTNTQRLHNSLKQRKNIIRQEVIIINGK